MNHRSRSRCLVLVGLLGLVAPAHAQPAVPATAPATRPAARPQVLPPGVTAHRDLKYGEAAGISNLLDIYVPADPAEKLPLVVWIHGGGWEAGDKRGTPALYMLARGYVVASINYRFSREAPFPAQIFDCKGAIRYLRAHAAEYHIDPERVGVAGDSAGGHLVALLGTSGDVKELEGSVGGNAQFSSRVQAVCDFYGPTDLLKIHEQQAPGGTLPRDPAKDPVAKLLGGPIDQHKELAIQANPITFVTKDDPPFLILHGDKDPLVPLAQSQMLEEALKGAGVEAKLEVIPGAGHGGPAFGSLSSVTKIASFFDQNLKKK